MTALPDWQPRQLPQYDRDLGLPGVFAPMVPGGSISSVSIITGRLSLARFVPSRTMIAKKIGFGVATPATADDAVEVGIYDAAGNLLCTSGAVTGLLNAPANPRSAAIPATQLKPATVYFAAFLCAAAGGTPAFVPTLNGGSFTAVQMFVPSGGASASLALQKDGLAQLPANIVLPGTASGTSCPLLAVMES